MSDQDTIHRSKSVAEALFDDVVALRKQLSEARADLNLLRDAGNELSTVLWGYDDSLAQEAIHAWNHAKQQVTPEVPR